MQVLKKGFSFYVFGNIHVALAAYCLTKISFLQFDIEDQELANFVFFSTVLSYNFIRFFQLEKINSMMANWMKANGKSLLALNALALLGSVYFLLSFNRVQLLTLLPFLLATVFYVFPFKKDAPGLRQIPGFKLFLIALTWTGLTLFLPLISAGISVTPEIYPDLIQRILFVLAITIPFDIRDTQLDVPGLYTLPQVLGVNTAKAIAVSALLFVIALDFFYRDPDSTYIWINLFVMVLSMLMVAFSRTTQNRFYTAFWIEAIPILWYLLYLILVN